MTPHTACWTLLLPLVYLNIKCNTNNHYNEHRISIICVRLASSKVQSVSSEDGPSAVGAASEQHSLMQVFQADGLGQTFAPI